MVSQEHQGNEDEEMSICGTPLYSSPQLLKRKGYSFKVDTWALGILTYELLSGTTPFHSTRMPDLIAKINKGDYTLFLQEPIAAECALFLADCLQANESDRINVPELLSHPFLAAADQDLTPLNKAKYFDYISQLPSDLKSSDYNIPMALDADHSLLLNTQTQNIAAVLRKLLEEAVSSKTKIQRESFQISHNQEEFMHFDPTDEQEEDLKKKTMAATALLNDTEIQQENIDDLLFEFEVPMAAIER